MRQSAHTNKNMYVCTRYEDLILLSIVTLGHFSLLRLQPIRYKMINQIRMRPLLPSRFRYPLASRVRWLQQVEVPLQSHPQLHRRVPRKASLTGSFRHHKR